MQHSGCEGADHREGHSAGMIETQHRKTFPRKRNRRIARLRGRRFRSSIRAAAGGDPVLGRGGAVVRPCEQSPNAVGLLEPPLPQHAAMELPKSVTPPFGGVVIKRTSVTSPLLALRRDVSDGTDIDASGFAAVLLQDSRGVCRNVCRPAQVKPKQVQQSNLDDWVVEAFLASHPRSGPPVDVFPGKGAVEELLPALLHFIPRRVGHTDSVAPSGRLRRANLLLVDRGSTVLCGAPSQIGPLAGLGQSMAGVPGAMSNIDRHRPCLDKASNLMYQY
jgi:hypothetical protein